jgi:hypothetical protein
MEPGLVPVPQGEFLEIGAGLHIWFSPSLTHASPSNLQWENSDVSNVSVIGDNYETEVLFLVGGFQYITSAMAFNFGYEFRRGWFQNYFFVVLATAFAFIHLYITLKPGELSCFWRVNCENESVVASVTFDPIPIQNKFNTTMMPESFQRGLIGIMIGNGVAIACWEFFVVNGIRRHSAAKKRQLPLSKDSENNADA